MNRRATLSVLAAAVLLAPAALGSATGQPTPAPTAAEPDGNESLETNATIEVSDLLPADELDDLDPSTTLAAPPGLGADDPWVDANGDEMFGPLDMGPNVIRLNGRSLVGTVDGDLKFEGDTVCLEQAANCDGQDIGGQLPIKVDGSTVLLSTQGCGDGELWKWTGSTWDCQPDRDTTYDGSDFAVSGQDCAAGDVVAGVDASGTVVCVRDQDTTYDGSDFTLSDQACPDGDLAAGVTTDGQLVCQTPSGDTLASLDCASDEIARWDGSSWVCSADQDTTYDGSDFALSEQSCSTGDLVAGVDASGVLVCAPDQDTTYDGSDFALSDQGCSSGGVVTGVDASGTLACEPGGDTLASLDCASDEIARWDGSSWVCSADQDTTYDGSDFAVSDQACPSGEVVAGVDASGNVACVADEDTDSDTLATLDCASDEIARWNGSSWVCSTDQDTTYTAGDGLELDGTTLDLTQACASSEVLKFDGASWTCSVDEDTDTTYQAGAGLELDTSTSPSSFQVTTACSSGDVLKQRDTDGDATADEWACEADEDTQAGAGAGLSWSGTGDHDVNAGNGLTVSSDAVDVLVGDGIEIASGSVALTQACAGAQVLKYDGAAWVCSADQDTTYDGSDFALSDQSCSTGDVVTGVDASGNVVCEDQTTVDAWLVGGNAGIDDATDVLGTTDEANLTMNVNGTETLRLEIAPNASNIVGGAPGNWVLNGVEGALVAGGGTPDLEVREVVGFGQYEIVSAGPHVNNVTDDFGTVGGGVGNQAGDGDGDTTFDARFATVGGGWNNTASGRAATVAGGTENTADGRRATVGGGRSNTVSDWHATISGGQLNTASKEHATVGGGSANTASGLYATVPGGLRNLADGRFSMAAGTGASASHHGTFVWSDSFSSSENAFQSTGQDQFLIEARGGLGVGTNAPSEQVDVAGNVMVQGGHVKTQGSNLTLVLDGARAAAYVPTAGTPNLVAGNASNAVDDGVEGAVVAGGGSGTDPNVASDDFTTVSGGLNNAARDPYTTVAGGGDNQAGTTIPGAADAHGATVAGGMGNTATGGNATVAGGANNDARWDDGATVAGGENNRAGRDHLEACFNGIDDDRDGLVDEDECSFAASHAAVGGGESNVANGSHATVGGGSGNTATSDAATVGGGDGNNAHDKQATVAGGLRNTAEGTRSVVGGGSTNVAGGYTTTIAGGSGNAAHENFATVGGGIQNTASAEKATVAGGYHNWANAPFATIGGGGATATSTSQSADTNNTVYDKFGTIGGGGNNTAGTDTASNVDAYGATVAGGIDNAASDENATVAGGSGNLASDGYATVGGGQLNTAGDYRSTVGGGHRNTANGVTATVAGGAQNTANSSDATVGGGLSNTASGITATVAGGHGNTASGSGAAIGGGSSNTASGKDATVAGGVSNAADGRRSLAAGAGATAQHDGSFVWSDSTSTLSDSFTSTGADQFLVEAAGGVGIGTNSPAAQLDVDGNVSVRDGGVNADGADLHLLPADGQDFTDVVFGDGTSQVPDVDVEIGSGGLCVDDDGSCIEATDGHVTAVQYNTGSSDLAEVYPSEDELEPGEVVALDPENPGHFERTTEAGQQGPLHVVSTDPGMLLGAPDGEELAQAGIGPEDGANFGETKVLPGTYPIALSGRVPVQATAENGPIEVGDPLTSSSAPGTAAKATGDEPVIGVALEPLEGAAGTVEVFVTPDPAGAGDAGLTDRVEDQRETIDQLEEENDKLRDRLDAIEERLDEMEE